MINDLHAASGDRSERRLSLGIVQQQPTQFDEPFYRYLATDVRLNFTVYYYGAGAEDVNRDPEIDRLVGWSPAADCAYSAAFLNNLSPGKFAGRVVCAGHDLLIVTGYNQPHALQTAIRARFSGVPVGLRSDNVLPAAGGRNRYWRIKRLMYPLLFKLYATAHPVGMQAAEYLGRFGFNEKALFRFPYGVDHRWFARESAIARADHHTTRRSWGLPVEGQVVCGVMKFSEREDPLTLIRAFHAVKTEHPELSLLLVGDGPLKSEVEREAGKQLGKSILLPGYQKYNMLPSAYAASDVFVHTATGAWEVSVNEALACGLPVITSDAVGSTQELVLPNRFGHTFPRGDADALAARIVSLLNDSEMITRVRERGLESLAEWDYPATADRLVSAIRFASRHDLHSAADVNTI